MKTKFGFQIADDFHSVLSVHEKRNGELIILPSFAECYSETEFGNPNAENKIKNQHYTVHNSPHLEVENVINHTLEYLDGTKTNTKIYTRALKRTNLFCPVISARAPDLSIERYKTRKDGKCTYKLLGNYDSSKFTLYYMVVVSNSGLAFNDNFADLNIITITFQKYSFSLLWSYGCVPSYSSGIKLHFLTNEVFETQIKEGFLKEEIISLYRLTRQFQHQNLLKFLSKKYPSLSDQLKKLAVVAFKKSPEIPIDDNDEIEMELMEAYNCLIMGQKKRVEGLNLDALKLFEFGAGVFKKHGYEIDYAYSLYLQGNQLQDIGLPSNAIAFLEEALEIYRKHNIVFHVARIYLDISFVHRDTGNVTLAMEKASEALRIASSEGLISLQADANKELGVLYKNLQELDTAVNFLNIALAKYKEIHHPLGEAYCLGNMGLLQAIKGKFKYSLKFHKKALAIFTTFDDKLGIANEIANMGYINSNLRNFDLGLNQLKAGLEGHKAIGYQFGIATDLKLIGGHFLNIGNYTNAREYLEMSKAVFLKIGNNREANQVSTILGDIVLK